MNENLLKSLDNIRTGAVQLSSPVVKFGVDTLPNLFTAGFKTSARSASKIVDAKKKGLQKILRGSGNAVGGGMVLGSSIIGGNMKLAGSGLGVVGNLVDAAARFGLEITGNLADTAALSNMLFANMTNELLNGIGGGLNAAGDGINKLSSGSSKVIDAVGVSISKSLSNAQKTLAQWLKTGTAKLEVGTLTLTTAAQVNYYQALQWYLNNLLAMEGIMDKLTETINNSGEKKPSSENNESETQKTSDDSKKDSDEAGDNWNLRGTS